MTPTPLRRSRVVEGLGPEHRFARDVRVLGIVGSTSDLVLKAAREGARDGLVIVAEGQTTGRGRRGTEWVSPSRKGLWFSALVTPPRDRTLLAPAVGLAVSDAITTIGLAPRLKWPNDVLVDDLKVAGCLVDLADDQSGEACAVIGIGVNANLATDELPTNSTWAPGSLAVLAGRPVDREHLLVATLSALDARLAQADADDVEGIESDWAPIDALVGRTITATEAGREITGTVTHIAPSVGLTLQTDDGTKTLRAETTHILSVDR